MNPFEIHDIQHLSPSSANLFTSAPAVFVLQKVLKRNTSVGAAAHRGTSVESGIAHGLFDPKAPLDECVKIAKLQFDTLTALTADPRADKEREGLAGMVAQGLNELRPYGVPTDAQKMVSHQPEGLLVPIIGYYDFVFGSKVVVDLKTSHSLTSKISSPHARQVALYKHCLEAKSGRISYVTSKKAATYELENSADHLNALERICMSIQKFLSISEDPQEIASMVSPDIESFYYNDPITRQAAFEVWGI
jgi:hypothetical protein